MTSALQSVVRYDGRHLTASWQGRQVEDADRFTAFLRDTVQPRLADEEADFEQNLRALAPTGFGTVFLERLLRAVPRPEAWEVGEALAECALRSDCDREIYWPWNTARDRRAPRASLPGSDLVGFIKREDKALLLFGEVKTSSEASAPPNVMYGGSGMTWQLERGATQLDVQLTLLKWLFSRCTTAQARALYKTAVTRYIASGGHELLIVGVLIRDTGPDENDLKSRGEVLGSTLASPTEVELFAWYLPVPIARWVSLLQEEAA